MLFAEIAKARCYPTLKSGFLCAVMLMPATVWADSTTGESKEPAQVAMIAAPDIDSTLDFIEAKPAHQGKVVNLSQHIQRKYGVPEHKATQIVREAVHNGDRHRVEPELILAIIAVESTFKERAVSRVGARGLMQVMPGSHKGKIREIGGSHALFDPAKNIHTGSRILVDYLNAHSGNLRRALLSYNGSLGTRSSFPDRVMRIYRDMQRVTTAS